MKYGKVTCSVESCAHNTEGICGYLVSTYETTDVDNSCGKDCIGFIKREG